MDDKTDLRTNNRSYGLPNDNITTAANDEDVCHSAQNEWNNLDGP